jgi:hypothetical protein
MSTVLGVPVGFGFQKHQHETVKNPPSPAALIPGANFDTSPCSFLCLFLGRQLRRIPAATERRNQLQQNGSRPSGLHLPGCMAKG